MKSPPDRVYWRLGPDLVVTSSSPVIHAALDTVFGAMRTVGSPPITPHRLHLDVRDGEHGSVVVLESGTPVVHADSVDRLPIVIESLLTHFASQLCPSCIVFHAGVVALDGQALLLPAERGSGKSTTSLWLSSHGFTYLGDDHAFVRLDDLAILPFAKAVTLKEGSFRLFDDVQTFDDAIRGPIRYMLPDRVAAVDESFPVRAIVFPQFDPDVALDSRRVDPPVAALALVQQCFTGMEGGEDRRNALLALAQKPAWLVRFNDAATFEAEVRRIWGTLP